MASLSGFITIVGRPNVGKSSLLNCLLGEKIAIISQKPQTTRTRITGVLTEGEKQYVFIDTPGLHQAKNKLGTHMVKAVNTSLVDIDLALLVIEPKGEINQAEQKLLETIKSKQIPSILIINKIDLIKDKKELMARIEQWKAYHDFDAIVPISVLEKDGIDVLKSEIDRFLIESPHFFPDDTLTDQPERVIVAEMIREKILYQMRQEIPHGIAIVVEKMQERENQELIDLHVTIFCEKSSHKGMLIGKNGVVLKSIASAAREDIEGFLGCKVNLQCWVKVKEDWRNKDVLIQNFGLSFRE